MYQSILVTVSSTILVYCLMIFYQNYRKQGKKLLLSRLYIIRVHSPIIELHDTRYNVDNKTNNDVEITL